jgi:mxaJ protein
MRAHLVMTAVALIILVPAAYVGDSDPVGRFQDEHRPRMMGVLRVCADPDNLPFSSDRGTGFENRVAELIASEINARIEYTWWPQRRGFLRNTLNAKRCDVVMGLPTAMEMALTTQPYYRSSYVFVSKADRRLNVSSFDDPRLRSLTIGVQMVGDDGANSPPAHALSRRGIIRNVRGYLVHDDPARIVRAVTRDDIDIAVVWGPLAAYVAAGESVPLRLTGVGAQMDTPALPLAFDISMAVRHTDVHLRNQLNEIIKRKRGEISVILAEYGVPRADEREVF